MKRSDNLTSGPLSGPLSGQLSEELSTNLIEALTLTGTRARLTTSPQMSFADLRVRYTAYGLELHCSQRRIRESLAAPVTKRTKPAKPSDDDTLFSEQTGLTILAIAATIFFVGGGVAITGSVQLGILIAALLPVSFWLIATPKGPKQYGKAILRVSSIPNGRTLLTLKTLPAPPPLSSSKAHKRLRTKHFAVKGTVQCANLPVRLVAASPKKRRLSHISFVFEAGNKCRGNKQLHITGTRQEIQWLHRHLAQQNHIPTAR